MADDKSSLSTDKPVVESSSASSSVRSSSGGRGGGSSGFGNRQVQRRQDSREEQSSETSVSLGNSSPAKTAKGPSNNRGDRKPNYGRDNKEGRQKRGGGGGGGRDRDRDQGQRHSTSENISGEGVTSAPHQELAGTGPSTSKKDNKKKYTVRKRAPPKEDFEIKLNDVFVNERSNFEVSTLNQVI